MFVTVGSGVLNTNNSGTDVVLSRFPDEGQDLTVFGLTPSLIKTIAIPNDIQEWPTTALSGCTNLESITVYGNEAQTGELSITRDYGLYNFAQLTSIQLPSTVTSIGDANASMQNPTFPQGLRSVRLPTRLTAIQQSAFYGTALASVDFSPCPHLQFIGNHAFRGGQLSSLDLSACRSLTVVANAAFYFCNNLACVTLPPSLTKIEGHAFRTAESIGAGGGTLPSPVKTIIWKGRTARPAIDDDTGIHTWAFAFGKTLADFVESGEITEIFLP